jgi:hypothetical protein
VTFADKIPDLAGRKEQPVKDTRSVLFFVVVSLVLRAPALLYSELNYDESMYLLMGSEFSRGHLPYTTICDLKPFGLFALAMPIAASPIDPVFTSRIVSSIAVGLTAWLLSKIAHQLFGSERQQIGISAGLCYVLFSIANGGMAFQGELFQNAASVWGLLIALKAVRRRVPPDLVEMCAAGLVLGIGIQIKQTVIFDIAAVLVGLFILIPAARRQAGSDLFVKVAPLLVLAAASLVPTVLVMLLYAVSGDLNAWLTANVSPHLERYELGYRFEVDPAFRAIWEQAPVWLGAIVGLALSRRLAADGDERRSVAFLGIWSAAVMACIVFLRISSDHYFLQFLPPLGLLTGFAIGRGLLAHIPQPRTAWHVVAVLAAVTLFAIAKSPLIHSLYILKDRVARENWAGDTPRLIAADLKPVLQQADAVYVVGFQPVIYVLTGARTPTRFAFTGLPNFQVPGRDGCPWVEPVEELQRIFESRPRFIVVERGVFVAEMRPDVRQILDKHLKEEYRLRRSFEEHYMHRLYPFERFVMNGGAAADLYELRVASGVARAEAHRDSWVAESPTLGPTSW